jgi:hypothetical protein
MVDAYLRQRGTIQDFWGKEKPYHALVRCVKKPHVPKVLSIEYHRLIPIDQHPVLKMPADSLSENGLFQILSLANQVFDGVAVTDPHYVLGDNRTLVKFGGNIVRRRPDKLDSSGVGLVIRPASGEGRQKTVVNIDDRDSGCPEKICAQNLHITREHDQIDSMPLKNRQLCLLRFCLAVPPHINVVKRQVNRLAKLAKFRMVRYHANQFSPHFTPSKTKNEILQAMRYPRNEYSDPCALVRNCGSANHTELPLGHRFKGRHDPMGIRHAARLRPLHPLKKNILFCISVLVGVEDVATLLENPAGDPRY